MAPRTHKLDLSDVIKFQQQEDESWQEQLKDVARGRTPGFVVEIVPEEVPGYGILPEREFKMKLLERTHALWNAIKHRLQAAAEEVEGEHEWGEWIMARRKDALVRVYRVVDEGGELRPMPEAFVQKILSTQVRTARSSPSNPGRVEGERKLVERRSNRDNRVGAR
jgi:hypothetical protein